MRSVAESEKLQKVKMSIHTGMLESLGVNMYTTIGQSIAEFVANSFDADAQNVEVSVPFEDITNARAEIRQKAKADNRDIRYGIYDPLPDNIEIVIVDDGHGMEDRHLEAKFLSLSRNRRKDESDRSESGDRFVMGRKGLGKLAGFGAAQKVVVETKRKGQDFSTAIEMDFDVISQRETIGDVEFDTVHKSHPDPEAQGTTIRLRGLRCDSMKAREATLRSTLAKNFTLLGQDFAVSLNGKRLVPPLVDFEFSFPYPDKIGPDGLAQINFQTEDGYEFSYRGVARFRARSAKRQGAEHGPLAASQRGAIVYCNGRKAAGPTLFNLPTGMHNFHSQSYLECVVEADFLDRMDVDLIGTNRQGLKTDNDIVTSFIESVTELMRQAIHEHGKFRDAEAIREVEADPESRTILQTLSHLDRKLQKPARKILEIVAASDIEGTNGEVYRQLAPQLVKAINATEVLTELIRSSHDPKSLPIVIEQLAELAGIEKSDVLKLYRGRRSGVMALQELEKRSHETGPQYEKELHRLLKDNPWLIRPEYSQHLTSDRPMGEVAQKLTKALKIDTSGDETSKDRPDLVFVTVDHKDPAIVTVVELKSPRAPLTNANLSQLEGYIVQVETILGNDYSDRKVRVQGHLIGSMGARLNAPNDQLLQSRIKKSGPAEQWEVVSLPALLDRAKAVFVQAIEAIEAEEDDA